ncbi:MAG: S9 family peptidase [Ignavibacteria bacterium]|nr:S9 family peptidase [Ignavibacteria bacterium]
MRYILLLISLVWIMVNNLFSQQPPIIDRELFFGDPEISGAQISPDGKYLTFLKQFNKVRNIWIKKIDEPFENAKPITADTKRPVTSYFWTEDSKFIIYVQDKDGDENYRVYVVNPFESGDPVPPAKNLTPFENVRAMIIDVPKKTPDEIIVGLNDRDPSLHDVYRLNIKTGERKLLYENKENIAGWATDLDGNLRLAIRQTEDGGTEILKFDKANKLTKIYEVTFEESVSPIRFTKDGNAFYLMTNKGKNRDKIQLELFDLKTGKSKLIDKDPLDEVDLAGALFSDITNELLMTYYVGEKIRIYPKEKKFKKDFETLVAQLPSGNIGFMSISQDENLWLVSVSSDVDPGSVYLFDRRTGKAQFVYKSRPNLPSEWLSEMKPIKYKARDGMTIYGYLTIPKGLEPKNLPVVMLIHGGPWARDVWGYNPIVQFLANRGYAVFQPNFRGSTGYGKKYLNAGNKQWGTGSMQHDITDAVYFLIKEGIADPKRVAIAGGSYGGYATLAGLAFTPDLYACGFDIVGPSNIITLLNSIPPYWKPIQKIFTLRVGDKDNPEERKMLEAQSPLNSATNIKAPLYVVQGANDPRVKKHESDQIVVALRDLGRDVEYMLAQDEGHGFINELNRLAMFTAMEKFFYKHLKGRIQEDVREEIKKKLEELTVDISKLEAPKKIDKTDNFSDLIFNPAKMFLGELNYQSDFELMGNKYHLEINRRVEKGNFEGKEVIRIVEQTEGIMSAFDTLDLDGKTLFPIRRYLVQGPGSVSLKFEKDKVTGLIKMGPQEMPINAKISKPVLSGGAGTELSLATLPLEIGYKTQISQFDFMSGQAQNYLVDVKSKEKIKVGNKDYEAYKVELFSEDENDVKQIIWYDTNTRLMLKTQVKLPPQAGGGYLVYELMD